MKLTKETFTSAMGYMQVVFGRKMGDDISIAFWQALCEMPEEAFLRAVKGIVQEFIPTASAPFPVPAHFLKYSGTSATNTAKTSIQAVKWAIGRVGRYNSVDFCDRVLHGVIDRWGGWIALCSWTDQDWQINQRRFEEDYEAAANSGLSGPEHLAGLVEATNGSAGFDYEPPQRIGRSETGEIIAIKRNNHKMVESKTLSPWGNS